MSFAFWCVPDPDTTLVLDLVSLWLCLSGCSQGRLSSLPGFPAVHASRAGCTTEGLRSQAAYDGQVPTCQDQHPATLQCGG